jgi:hypothetical protein
MQTLPFMTNLEILPKRQISTQLADQFETLYFLQGMPAEEKNRQLIAFAYYLQFILKLGESEHTGDWDPSIKLTFFPGTQDIAELETQAGYADLAFSKNGLDPEACPLTHEALSLLVYDYDYDNDEDLIRTIDISTISSIQTIFN